MEDLASIFGSTQRLSSAGFLVRTLAVGLILYFASRYGRHFFSNVTDLLSRRIK